MGEGYEKARAPIRKALEGSGFAEADFSGVYFSKQEGVEAAKAFFRQIVLHSNDAPEAARPGMFLLAGRSLLEGFIETSDDPFPTAASLILQSLLSELNTPGTDCPTAMFLNAYPTFKTEGITAETELIHECFRIVRSLKADPDYAA